MEVVSQIISGAQGEIILREKSDQPIELGEILIAEDDHNKILLQVYDLQYGSQMDDKRIELASGLNIEENWKDLKFYDSELRSYVLAKAKALAQVKKDDKTITVPKRLPKHFSMVRRFTEEDSEFIAKHSTPLFIGNLRSGSNDLKIPVFINGLEALSHHVLVAATTGRGKSNFLKVMLWNVMDKDYCGILVLDPHDEYYEVLEKSGSRENLYYYTTKKGIAGAYSLRIGAKTIKPDDLFGVIGFSEPQEQAVIKYWKEFGDDWLLEIVKDKKGIFEKEGVHPGTLLVVQRKIHTKLGIRHKDGDFVCDNDVFDVSSGEKTIDDICSFLSKGKKVVIDTSMLMDEAELLVGSIIANRILEIYKMKKSDNKLRELPVVAIVIEEAPRVLSENKINQNNNIYATIAREGRKFKIGLVAITQLSSVIPKEIMANMNTKIIFGNELAMERDAIISSASQDLSKDGKNIASLGRGEAIISSIFTNFAVPVKVPYIEDVVKNEMPTSGPRRVL